MATRDRVVLWVLLVGAVLSIAAWQAVGRWPALVVAILAVLAACLAYRVEAPHLPVDVGPETEDADRLSGAGMLERPIDQ